MRFLLPELHITKPISPREPMRLGASVSALLTALGRWAARPPVLLCNNAYKACGSLSFRAILLQATFQGNRKSP